MAVKDRLSKAIHEIALSYLSWGYDQVGEQFSHLLREYVADELIENCAELDGVFQNTPNLQSSMQFAIEIADKFRNHGFTVTLDFFKDPNDGSTYRCVNIGTKRVIYLSLSWEERR